MKRRCPDMKGPNEQLWVICLNSKYSGQPSIIANLYQPITFRAKVCHNVKAFSSSAMMVQTRTLLWLLFLSAELLDNCIWRWNLVDQWQLFIIVLLAVPYSTPSLVNFNPNRSQFPLQRSYPGHRAERYIWGMHSWINNSPWNIIPCHQSTKGVQA